MYAAHLYILRSLLAAYEGDHCSCPRPTPRPIALPPSGPDPEQRHAERATAGPLGPVSRPARAPA